MNQGKNNCRGNHQWFLERSMLLVLKTDRGASMRFLLVKTLFDDESNFLASMLPELGERVKEKNTITIQLKIVIRCIKAVLKSNDLHLNILLVTCLCK